MVSCSKNMTQKIVKVVVEVFCFEEDQEAAVNSLEEWFTECEVDLYGNPPLIKSPSAEEEMKARPELE